MKKNILFASPSTHLYIKEITMGEFLMIKFVNKLVIDTPPLHNIALTVIVGGSVQAWTVVLQVLKSLVSEPGPDLNGG